MIIEKITTRERLQTVLHLLEEANAKHPDILQVEQAMKIQRKALEEIDGQRGS